MNKSEALSEFNASIAHLEKAYDRIATLAGDLMEAGYEEPDLIGQCMEIRNSIEFLDTLKQNTDIPE